MIENPKSAAYFKLIYETEQQTLNTVSVDRPTGLFAQVVFNAMITGLSHEEMRAAATIGHHRGCKRENASPDYTSLFDQLAYWEAIYDEAEQFWFQRCRTDNEG